MNLPISGNAKDTCANTGEVYILEGDKIKKLKIYRRMKIDFANLGLQYQLYKAQINKRVLRVLEDSKYIMGPEIEELESALKEFTSAKNCITCSSGTDALTLATCYALASKKAMKSLLLLSLMLQRQTR